MNNTKSIGWAERFETRFGLLKDAPFFKEFLAAELAAAEERGRQHDHCSGIGVEDAFKAGRAAALKEAIEAVSSKRGRSRHHNEDEDRGWNESVDEILKALSALTQENKSKEK